MAEDYRIDGKIIKRSMGICHICNRIVEASVIEKEGALHFEKSCPEDGIFTVPHFLENSHYYKETERFYNRKSSLDSHSAVIVIDVTYKCDCECNFCYAQANERKEADPTLEEIIRQVKDFKGHYVYLGGGEPTLREDIFLIIQTLKKMGFFVVLMTSGKKLVDLNFVKNLEKTGLDYIQLQFDTLDDAQYISLMKEKMLDIKFKALDNIKKTSLPVYLWARLVKGLNENQIVPLVQFVAENASRVKYLILVDVWCEGRVAFKQGYVTREEMWDTLRINFGLTIDDFLDYMEFDYYLFDLYSFLKKERYLRRSTPCASRCHCFFISNKIVPLARIVDLKKINGYLKKIVERIKSQRSRIKNLFFLVTHIPYFLIIREIIINREIRRYIFRNIRFLFPRFFKRNPLNANENSFTLVIGPYMDRYNFDYKLCEYNCHMQVDLEGRLMPFCLKEILRGKGIRDPLFVDGFKSVS